MLRYIRKFLISFLSYWRIRWLEIGYRLFGIEYVNEKLLRTTVGVSRILTHFGATMGPRCIVHGPLIVHNAEKDYSNLILCENVHIGRNVLFDLTDTITISDNVVISMNCTLLTHQDLGDRPQQSLFPRKVRPLMIGQSAYLGAGSTILVGADVGEFSVVGASALVNKPVASHTVVGGVPASVLKSNRSEQSGQVN